MAIRIPRPIAAQFTWMPEFIRNIERAIEDVLAQVTALISSSGSRTVLTLAANEVNTSASDVVIADANGNWDFPIEDGQVYRIEVIGGFTTAASTTGARITCSIDVGSGVIHGSIRATLDNTPGTAEYVKPLSGSGAGILTPSAVGAQSIHIDAILVCTGSGSANLAWRTEVGGSAATLLAGSTLIVTRL